MADIQEEEPRSNGGHLWCRMHFGWSRVSAVYDKHHTNSKHISSSLLLGVLSPSKSLNFLASAEISVFLLALVCFRKHLLSLLR